MMKQIIIIGYVNGITQSKLPELLSPQNGYNEFLPVVVVLGHIVLSIFVIWSLFVNKERLVLDLEAL